MAHAYAAIFDVRGNVTRFIETPAGAEDMFEEFFAGEDAKEMKFCVGDFVLKFRKDGRMRGGLSIEREPGAGCVCYY